MLPAVRLLPKGPVPPPGGRLPAGPAVSDSLTEIGDRGGEIRGARMGPPPRLLYKPNFYFQEVTYMSRMAVIYWSMTGNTEAMGQRHRGGGRRGWS